MADLKISQLPVKATIDTTDLLVIVDNQSSPTTKQVAYNNVIAQMIAMTIALS